MAALLLENLLELAFGCLDFVLVEFYCAEEIDMLFLIHTCDHVDISLGKTPMHHGLSFQKIIAMQPHSRMVIIELRRHFVPVNAEIVNLDADRAADETSHLREAEAIFPSVLGRFCLGYELRIHHKVKVVWVE